MRVPSRVTRNRRRPIDQALLRGAIAVGVALLSTDAAAQVSGSVSIVSDYRYRGVSLSDRDPAAQVGVAYDDAQGWYAGAFLSTVRLAASSSRDLQAVPFVGYVWQFPSGVSTEIGASYSVFTGAHSYGYSEVYWGFASGNVSGRLYYSPRYFGRDADAVYAELNGAQPITERIRLLAHVGALRTGGGDAYGISTDHNVFDARVGIGFELDPFNVQLSWVTISSTTAGYPVAGNRGRNGTVLTLSRSF